MKRMKKIVSMLLAVVMVLGMSMTVFAADNHSHTITVTQNKDDKTEHIYDAYQIFAGDLATVDGKTVLSNIIWGSGVAGDALLDELKADDTFLVDKTVGGIATKVNAFADCEDAADVAEVLGNTELFTSSNVNTSTLTDAFARLAEKHLTNVVAGTNATTEEVDGTEVVKGTVGNATIEVTGSGYYLVKDRDDSVDTDAGAYSRFMLEVVGNATVNVKSEVPSGDKKVFGYDINDQTQYVGDSNNAPIGSHVSYQITSKVPNYTGYQYYYFIMNDTLSEGLTFDGVGTVKVTVAENEITQGLVTKNDQGEYVVSKEGDYYVYTEDVDPYTFRLAFADITKYGIGEEIILTYSATVNDQAAIGVEGNPNAWDLNYSNKPDDTWDGTPTPDKRPGLPDDDKDEPLGKTPDEITLTYVTQLDITKYANEVLAANLLAGAEFTLTGTSYQVVLDSVEYYEASTTTNAIYYLLLDGTYTETPPTGTEYVEIGVGTKDTTTGYIKVGDNYIVPDDAKDYEGETLYKLVKGTASSYADVNTKYEKKTKVETTYVEADVSIELTTEDDGKISFKDLGAGTYTLTETVTPDGFNTLDPITIVIGFEGPKEVKDGTEECNWTMTWDGTEITGTNGIFAQDVINQSGSLLPSTGGIGTTIFYVVGAILVIGAGILLVAKKRMSNR